MRAQLGLNAYQSPARFEALDGCRGLFALMVALMHLQLGNDLFTHPFVRASYLAVDFFFVLSGFVIAHATRLHDAGDLARFAWRRFARVWPLHALMLCMFLGLELLKLVLQLRGVGGDTPAFAPNTQVDPGAIPAHLLLLHGMHLFPRLTWNLASWSISAEYYTYLLFAVCALYARRIWLTALTLAAIGATLLGRDAADMDVTFDLGFLRCVFGFFTGVLVQRAFASRPTASARRATARELGCLGLAVVLQALTGANRWSLLAPLVFAPAIFVFAREQGALSPALKSPPLKALGRWSYAIYMVHGWLYVMIFRVAHILERRVGHSLFSGYVTPKGVRLKLLTFGGPWTMGLLTLAIVALVIAVAALANRYVEVPAQRWLSRVSPFRKVSTQRERSLPTPTAMTVAQPAPSALAVSSSDSTR
jgi:peptidoglycan/LPS O-acetylase OafA/YrhL